MSRYHSKYGLYNCWLCLCEVCTRIGCPMHYRYHEKMEHCVFMMKREKCPKLKCDFFQHREKFLIMRVKSKRTKTDGILELLKSISDRLDRIEHQTSKSKVDKEGKKL